MFRIRRTWDACHGSASVQAEVGENSVLGWLSPEGIFYECEFTAKLEKELESE